MPIDGGSSELVQASAIPNGFMQGGVNFSPDGRWMPEIAGMTDAATQMGTNKVVLVDVNANSAAATKTLDPRADIALPIAFTPDGKAVAYTIVENGIARLQKISIARDLGTEVEVHDGVKPGDQVILNPMVNLMEGSKVTVRKAQTG